MQKLSGRIALLEAALKWQRAKGAVMRNAKKGLRGALGKVGKSHSAKPSGSSTLLAAARAHKSGAQKPIKPFSSKPSSASTKRKDVETPSKQEERTTQQQERTSASAPPVKLSMEWAMKAEPVPEALSWTPDKLVLDLSQCSDAAASDSEWVLCCRDSKYACLVSQLTCVPYCACRALAQTRARASKALLSGAWWTRKDCSVDEVAGGVFKPKGSASGDDPCVSKAMHNLQSYAWFSRTINQIYDDKAVADLANRRDGLEVGMMTARGGGVFVCVVAHNCLCPACGSGCVHSPMGVPSLWRAFAGAECLLRAGSSRLVVFHGESPGVFFWQKRSTGSLPHPCHGFCAGAHVSPFVGHV